MECNHRTCRFVRWTRTPRGLWTGFALSVILCGGAIGLALAGSLWWLLAAAYYLSGAGSAARMLSRR